MTEQSGFEPSTVLDQRAEEIVEYLQQSAVSRSAPPSPSILTCSRLILTSICKAFQDGHSEPTPGDVMVQAQELGRLLRKDGYQLRDVFQCIAILRKSAIAELQEPANVMNKDQWELERVIGQWFDGLTFAAVNVFHEAQSVDLQQRVVLDGLTGVFNRAYFGERLMQEISRAERYSHQLVLLMIDVDGLKPVNDRFGHQAGDTVLKIVSNALRAQSRLVDVVARYGGDEFAIIMPETTREGGVSLAERVVRAIYNHEGRQMGETVSVSVGVASFPHDANDADGLIEAADRALYRSKSQGGNSVVSFSSALYESELSQTPYNGEQARNSDRVFDRPSFDRSSDISSTGSRLLLDDDSVRQLVERTQHLEMRNVELKLYLEMAKKKLEFYERLEASLQDVLSNTLRSVDVADYLGQQSLWTASSHKTLGADSAPESAGSVNADESLQRDGGTRGELTSALASYALADTEEVFTEDDSTGEQLTSDAEDDVARRGALQEEIVALERRRDQVKDQVAAMLKTMNGLLATLGNAKAETHID